MQKALQIATTGAVAPQGVVRSRWASGGPTSDVEGVAGIAERLRALEGQGAAAGGLGRQLLVVSCTKAAQALVLRWAVGVRATAPKLGEAERSDAGIPC